MKRVLRISVLGVLFCVLLCACRTNMSVTYSVATGDSIRITLDTTDGCQMSGQSPFLISKNGVVLGTGIFLTMEDYSAYLSAVQEGGENIRVIEEGNRDGSDYIFYRCEGENSTEYDFLLKVKDSHTGILLGCETSQELAEACFEALTFEKAP
ncbi:MAG: hypothetical protein PUC59_06390 [Firmicutes bacterium]|nr:hypothetical protein [Bacillota bacterium]